MGTEFENEVIDRLARIETEQKYIREELTNLYQLEERVSILEAEENKRKGRTMTISALLLTVVAVIGGSAGVIVGRLFP